MRSVPALSMLLLACSSASIRADEVHAPDATQRYLAKLSMEAGQGDTRSQVCLGDLYASGVATIGQDMDKAQHLFQEAADHGDLEGQRHLGMVYMFGGASQDVGKASAIFRTLADKGYVPAYLDMFLMYANGAGVAQDDAAAQGWLEKGAAGGDPEAQIRLAIRYHFGNGVKKDDVVAQGWLAKAVSQDIDCLSTYGRLLPYIANVYYVDTRTEAQKKRETGRFGIRFIYADQRATHIEMMQSSGSETFDGDWMQALGKATLPRWPKDFVTDDYTMGFWFGG